MVLMQGRTGLCLTIIPASSSVLQEGCLVGSVWFSTEMKMVLVVLATLFLLFTPLCSCLRGMSANTTCSSTCLPARLRLSDCMKCVEQEKCTHRVGMDS